MLTVQVTSSDVDCARATRFVLNRRISTRVTYAFPALFVIGLGVVLWLTNPQSVKWWYVPALLVLLVWLYLTLILAQLWGLKRQMRKRLTSSPVAQGPQTFAFTDDGVTVSGALFNTNLKWNAIVEAVESKTDFFLYISKTWAYFLPKRYFESEGHQQQLRDFLMRNLGKRAKLGTDR